MRAEARNRSSGGRDAGLGEAGGFTLVEMLMALVMFSVVGLVSMQFMTRQSAAFNRTNEVAAAQQGVRAAVERIGSDIRVVGQGLNFYDIQVPDMIVPNDGTVGVNTFRNDAISLIAIPDPSDPSNQLTLDPTVNGNGNVGDTDVTVTVGSDLSGLAAGERLILFDPNTGNSQVVALTGIVGQKVQFANDPLTFQFAATGSTPSRALKLSEVRYRVKTTGGLSYLERKINRGAWVRFIEGITRLTFTYYDSNGNAFTPGTQVGRRDIRRVAVEIEGVQLRMGSGSERRAHVILTTSAVPRNMLAAP